MCMTVMSYSLKLVPAIVTVTHVMGKNRHTHYVATDAAIICWDGKTCGLSDLLSGHIVRVTMDTKHGKTMATKVEDMGFAD